MVKVPISGKVEAVPFNAADSYKQIHDAVGGYIEAAVIPAISTKENYTIDCFVDEEGLLKALPLNTRISFFSSAFIAGNAVFVAHNVKGETIGLSKADADTIVAYFNKEVSTESGN